MRPTQIGYAPLVGGFKQANVVSKIDYDQHSN